MSFIAKLFLDNTEHIVRNARVSFRQGVDINGLPCTFPQGGIISLKIDTTHDNLFFEWAVAPTMMKEGYIRFYKPDGMSRFVDFEFWDCYCVDYYEYFSHNSREAMFMDLVLSPGVLRFRNVIFEKHWKVTDLNRKDTAPITYAGIEEETPEMLEAYFEDEKGEKINVLRKDETVFLVVKTKDMKGKKIDVNLNNCNIDFELDGKMLQNDVLKDHTVTSNLMKIQLKTIKQN